MGKKSSECFFVLNLQRSNLVKYYLLNIKIYIQGIFGINYIVNKNLIVNDTGDIFRREPKEYSEIFNFGIPLDDNKRIQKLTLLFDTFIIPFSEKALSLHGIKELAQNNEICLLKEELKIKILLFSLEITNLSFFRNA